MSIELSVVIPVYNEGHLLVAPLERILDTVTIPCEVLVIYDSPDDTSIEHLKKLAEENA